MILSIGYRWLTPGELVAVRTHLRKLTGARVTIVDVRGSTRRCKAGFGQRQLEARFGPGYEYRGHELGNRAPNTITPEGLDRLVRDHASGRVLVLMCACDAPGDCHRHQQIAYPLLARGVVVGHLFDGGIVSARDLEESFADDSREPDSQEVDVWIKTRPFYERFER